MKNIKKVITIVAILCMILPAVTTSANAETAEIASGNYSIATDGTYQLSEAYSGIITIENTVNEVTITDMAYQSQHSGTSIIVAGGRSTPLELTIDNISITAAAGYSGIDFGNASGGFDNKLYIRGICSVTGGDNHAGIHVPDGVKLSIDKLQSDASDQLTVTGGKPAAGIGGGAGATGGAITINGGTITAVGGAYIDPAKVNDSDFPSGGAGIGGGGYTDTQTGGAGGIITINDGTVNASGGALSAGIGGGFGGAGGTVTINGGTVNAASSATGIGSGLYGTGGTVIINGGTVTAAGCYYSPGIGTGYWGADGTVAIYGGIINAIGGEGAAGIGSGPGDYFVTGCAITIKGGTVTAIGGSSTIGHGGGAGIGIGYISGEVMISSTIKISGGTINATGGPSAPGISGDGGCSVDISGGTVTAAGGKNGAGIGGGNNREGSASISGGTVIATGGKNGAGIGGGNNIGPCMLNISGTPKITATGDTANQARHIGAGGGMGNSEFLDFDYYYIKDADGKKLDYLHFNTGGVSGASICLEGISDIYTTDDQGVSGIFIPRTDSASYTVSKAGYAAVRDTVSLKSLHYSFDISIPFVSDHTPSSIMSAAPSLLKKRTPVQVTFNNDYGLYGTLYLVPKTGTIYTSKSALDNVSGKKAITINDPVMTASFDTTGLNGGCYEIYLVDSAENISAPYALVIDDMTTPVPVPTPSSGDSHYTGEGHINVASDKAEKEKGISIPVKFPTVDPVKVTEIKTKYASLTLPTNWLPPEVAGTAQTATITVNKADVATLPTEVQTKLNGRPIIELALNVDGKTVSWNNPDAPVTVSIPYTPTAEELANPQNITIWYIDGQGNIISVPSGRYDRASGTVKFTTTHFSKFAIAYVTANFSDLGNVNWAKNSIEVLASKGILKGISDKEYAPQSNITRADFLYLFVRTLGIDAKVDANFDDISKDAYYSKEIAIAKKLGITSGIGNNKFNPDATITRQDMIVLTERTLRLLNKLDVQGTALDMDKFTDQSLVAEYAVSSIPSVIKEGLIVGNGNKINPLGKTTRAEAAVFLYRIYNK